LTARRDTRLVPAVLTALLGLGLCYFGYQMPRPGGWGSSPGLFPIIIGIGLVVLAAALLAERARLRKNAASSPGLSRLEREMEDAAAEEPMTQAGLRATVAVTAVIVAYVIALSYAPFEIATFSFLVAAMWIFGERSWPKIIIVALAVVSVIAVIFISFLQTLLPGTESLIEKLLL
jgi:Tripartite tricarboxylate transporter TctB family